MNSIQGIILRFLGISILLAGCYYFVAEFSPSVVGRPHQPYTKSADVIREAQSSPLLRNYSGTGITVELAPTPSDAELAQWDGFNARLYSLLSYPYQRWILHEGRAVMEYDMAGQLVAFDAPAIANEPAGDFFHQMYALGISLPQPRPNFIMESTPGKLTYTAHIPLAIAGWQDVIVASIQQGRIVKVTRQLVPPSSVSIQLQAQQHHHKLLTHIVGAVYVVIALVTLFLGALWFMTESPTPHVRCWLFALSILVAGLLAKFNHILPLSLFQVIGSLLLVPLYWASALLLEASAGTRAHQALLEKHLGPSTTAVLGGVVTSILTLFISLLLSFAVHTTYFLPSLSITGPSYLTYHIPIAAPILNALYRFLPSFLLIATPLSLWAYTQSSIPRPSPAYFSLLVNSLIAGATATMLAPTWDGWLTAFITAWMTGALLLWLGLAPAVVCFLLTTILASIPHILPQGGIAGCMLLLAPVLALVLWSIRPVRKDTQLATPLPTQATDNSPTTSHA